MTEKRITRLVREFIGDRRNSFTIADFTKWTRSGGTPVSEDSDLDLAAQLFVINGYLTRDKNSYERAAPWFTGAEFLVTLTEEETEKAVLVPGHRFEMFAWDTIDPHEITLVTEDGAEIPKKTVSFEYKAFALFVSLLQIDQASVYISENHEENAEALRNLERNPNPRIQIIVFDVSGLIADARTAGSASFLCTAKDPERGIYEIRPNRPPLREGAELRNSRSEYVKLLDAAFKKTIALFGTSITTVQQIALAYYRAGKPVLVDPPLHFGGYLEQSKRLNLLHTEDRTFLWHGPYTGFSTEPSATLDIFLNTLGLNFTEIIIESYIRDRFYSDDTDRGALYDRLFEGFDLQFVDESEGELFFGLLDELWEEIEQSYNRFTDRERGPIRRIGLAILDDERVFVRSLDARLITPDRLPPAAFEIPEATRIVSNMLHLLNNDDPLTTDELLQMPVMTGHLEHLDAVVSSLISEGERQLAEMDIGGTRSTRPAATRSNRGASAGGKSTKGGKRGGEKQRACVLKISLNGSHPPIWRRVRVPDDLTLAELHQVIQIAMGWTDSHLHAFIIDGVEYSDPEYQDDGGWPGTPRPKNEFKTRIKHLDLAAGRSFGYTYDFGDDWEHSIKVEKILTSADLEPGEITRVVCLKGKRACPPEDCGGVFGYESMLAALADPASEDYTMWSEYGYEDFDPEEFFLEDVNEELDEAFPPRG